MHRWVGLSIVLPALLVSSCGQDTHAISKAQITDMATPASGFAPPPRQWGPHEVAAFFLDPAQANLVGGEIRTVAAGHTGRVLLCVSLDFFKLPAAAVPKRYATSSREIGVPSKGRITQQGWVMPTEAEAAALMRRIRHKLPKCHYSGSAASALQPGTRVSGISTPHTYSLDEYGWRGHRIEQTLSTNNRRASVNTRLLIQRGSVVLALEYINYTPKTHEQQLREYNMTILRKVLQRSS